MEEVSGSTEGSGMKTITSQSGTVHLVDDRPGRYPQRIRTACDFNIKGELNADERAVDCQWCAAYITHGEALMSQMKFLVQEQKKLYVADLAAEIGTSVDNVVNAAMCMPSVFWADRNEHDRFFLAKTQEAAAQQGAK